MPNRAAAIASLIPVNKLGTICGNTTSRRICNPLAPMERALRTSFGLTACTPAMMEIAIGNTAWLKPKATFDVGPGPNTAPDPLQHELTSCGWSIHLPAGLRFAQGGGGWRAVVVSTLAGTGSDGPLSSIMLPSGSRTY